MNIISVRENPQYAQRIITYLQQCWNEMSPILYSDCISHCIDAVNPLPQWYVLEKEGKFIGGTGLINNDFISRMDLYPCLCALFIDENHRGNNYAQMLIEKTKEDARKFGFIGTSIDGIERDLILVQCYQVGTYTTSIPKDLDPQKMMNVLCKSVIYLLKGNPEIDLLKFHSSTKESISPPKNRSSVYIFKSVCE